MNNDFEKRLQRITPCEIPSAWRKEVLTAAQEAQSVRHKPIAARPSLLSTLIHQLSTLTRPQRAAWAAITGVWFVILALNLAARDHATAASTTASLPARETLQALKQQRRLLAELVERPTPPAAERPKATPVGPRSQRREETVTA